MERISAEVVDQHDVGLGAIHLPPDDPPAVAFVGIMMLASTLGKTEQAAAGAGWAIMIPLAMFGEGSLPLFMMPDWMAAASHFIPVKWAILATEGALWRRFSFREMLLPCAILTLVGVAAFAAGLRTFRRE